ncbi:ABC transporter substrate-binding protein [Clostridium sp. Cult1]|uniref:ABC transporter substrate-binding protein n=1 Tax=Clostridium sp. Cult1 TaxID=2079002 RepID=UPI001F22FBAA|nr:extracellular solute-binding protein [Clostridium sp. Cult1]MCF6462444.1 ABC transporter substrate-binding protein [Clostridium sp. Cult1]
MRKIISFVLLGFMLVWTYNLFINNFIILEEAEEEPYKGIIKLGNISWDSIGKGSHSGWLKERIQAFERRNPGVYIELTPIAKDSLNSSIKDNSLLIDDMPDIVPVDSNFRDFNILEPLDEYFSKEDLEEFKHHVLKSVRYKDCLIAIPIGISTNVMYINLDKFHERGVSPPVNGNWSYEEFVDTLKRLTHDSDEDGIIDEYGLITSIGNNNYDIWGIILSDGGELINYKRMEYNFYGEKAIKGLEKVIDLKEKHRVVPDYFGIINEKDAWEVFYKDQKVAITIAGVWASGFLEQLYRDGEGFNFDIVNYPMGDKELPVILSNDIVSYGIIKKEDPKKTDMCIKFLKYLTNESNQRSLEKLGLFTVKRGIKDMYIDNLKMKKIEESIDYTNYIPYVDNWVEIDAIVQEEIRKAILGEKASYEAIEDAKMEIDKLKNQN